MALTTNAAFGDSDHTLKSVQSAIECIPATIGRYHILEQIGEGGMGNVFRAEQREGIRRTVAIKIIKLGMDTKEVIARFESERQALALMNHPNVAKVFDAGATETGRPYFVMEYVAGEPITSFCDRHQFTTRQRLSLFVQVCHAVQHAHQKAIIHRDLKPSNMLVTLEDGQALVKVIDFGVAKATAQKLTERTLFTETGHLIGTPEYMSPEQAEMNALDVDTRGDVYSLGVVLYELLAGVLPFDPKTLRGVGFAEIQRIVREVEPPRPSTRLSGLGAGADEVARKRQTQVAQLREELLGELEWIPLKAMRKDRAQRYSTAAEMALDIENYLEHLPLIAGPESAGYRFKKFLRRNKGPVTAAGAVGLALLLGMAATAVALVGQARARAEAERQRAEAEIAHANSKAVVEFLTRNVIGAADPAVRLGRELNVREALDLAAASVSQQFKDRPLVEAAVRNALAATYQSLGLPSLGLPHAQASLELQRRLLGADHPDTLLSLTTTAQLLAEDGKLPEAERLFREAISRRRATLGADHPATLESIDNLGHVLQDQGRRSEAEPLLREAMESRRRVLGDEHTATLSSIQNLGLLLKSEGKLDEAEMLFRQGLETSRRVLGNDHPETLTAMNNMGFLLQASGKLSQAEPILREAMEGRRRILGEHHVKTLISMNNFGALLLAEGKLSEAEPLFREAVRTCRATLGDDHPYTLYFVMNVGNVLREQDALPEAEAAFREAVERRRRVLGETNPETLLSVTSLAGVLTMQRRYDEADRLLTGAIERSRTAHGPTHAQTLRLLGERGELRLSQGRLDEAEVVLADVYRSAPGAQMPARDQARCVARYGLCLAARGRHAEAKNVLADAHRRLSDSGFPNDRQMRQVVAAMVGVCRALNETAAAQNWQEQHARLEATTRPAVAVSTTRPDVK